MDFRSIKEAQKHRRSPQSIFGRSNRLLDHADRRYANEEKALKNARDLGDLLRFGIDKKNYGNSLMRIAKNYSQLHSTLDLVSGGDLQGKNILHIGASTGVYAHFLQEYYGAKAIALDIDSVALKQASERGVKNVLNASAIPKSRRKFVQTKRGLKVVKGKSVLPIPTASMDFIVSDNFLFSNFHKGFATPGFEEREGSFRMSEKALFELNRVMKKGGKLVVGSVHGDALDRGIQKYKAGYKKHGFVVEKVFFQDVEGKYLATIVFRKVKDEY